MGTGCLKEELAESGPHGDPMPPTLVKVAKLALLPDDAYTPLPV
ncbi:MAG TPA: hypothetical protein VKF32_00830 [Thermoanaerobaculia bacterium]|nr:hypothetical protein [Thermoanaerobaculia bacterium]